jgi:hypothetical protein
MALKFIVPGDATTGAFGIDHTALGDVIYETHIATEGQTTVPVQAGYVPGTHQLQVFRNGVRQMVDVDYKETNSTQVDFLTPLQSGDVILFTEQGIYTERLHFEYIAEASQTVFTLPAQYHPGLFTLMVFVNGMLQRVNVDYLETDPQTVTFIEPLRGGELVTFHEQI